VPYTIVSRGRVLGTTDFEYTRWRKGFRGGTFSPAPDVASLMEIAVGVSPAANSFGTRLREMDRQADRGWPTLGARSPHFKMTTEHADLASACDRERSLELELRAPDGSLIATEWIAIQDTEFLLSLADGDVSDAEWYDEWPDDESPISAADLSDLDDMELFDESDSWDDELDLDWIDQPDEPFPRYQIFVTLVNDANMP
jgi:hypothetical protein